MERFYAPERRLDLAEEQLALSSVPEKQDAGEKDAGKEILEKKILEKKTGPWSYG